MSAAPEKTYCSILVRSFRLVDGQRYLVEQPKEVVFVLDGAEPSILAAHADGALAAVSRRVKGLARREEGQNAA